MSTTATWQGDADLGERLADEALALFHELGAREQIGMVLMAKGFACLVKGDLSRGRPYWVESLEIANEVGDFSEAAMKRLAIASIDYRQNQRRPALVDALSALQDLDRLRNVSFSIMALDFIAAMSAEERPAEALRLSGAAGALRRRLGGGMTPEASGLESARTLAARTLPAERLDQYYSEGETMKLAEAVTYAKRLVSGSDAISHISQSHMRRSNKFLRIISPAPDRKRAPGRRSCDRRFAAGWRPRPASNARGVLITLYSNCPGASRRWVRDP